MSTGTAKWAGWMLAAGMVVLALGAARPAQACGGTFCDAGPASMPVEQTGETILFVVDEGFVEAHIQIQYDPTTEAEQFAWVVPVTALPEFSVGSQRRFATVLGATVPAFGFSSWNEPCGTWDDGGGWDGCDGTGGVGGVGGDDTGGEKLDLGQGPEEPEVVLATSVGAFEVFVLDGGTVEGVMQWLGDNGFAQDPAAEPILAEYLAERHLFVAFRLAQQADVAEIHPITLRYAGDEPCVPIRLTRIAAKDDMDIRALFLADARVASSNWRHVTLNPLRIDWLDLGASYRELVTRAVDEPGADGHAFVTEYAGPVAPVEPDGLRDPRWDAAAFATATPDEAVMQLLDQALYDWQPATGSCGPSHPLVEGLVARYLPPLDDVSPDLLCEAPVAYAALVDPLAWDGPAFAAALEERVIAPSERALELLQTFPVLTRLYTTLSPHEMTEDPMFHLVPDLPEVDLTASIGTRNSFCDGHTSFGLPDGRLVTMPRRFVWPEIAPDQMPLVETIEYLPAAGAPVVEVDHRDAIAALLDAWHAEHGPPRSPVAAACGDGPGASSDTDSAGASEGGGKGCGCRQGGDGPASIVLLGLAGLGLRRRRRGARARPNG